MWTLLLFAVFQAVFSWAQMPMNLIQNGIAAVSGVLLGCLAL